MNTVRVLCPKCGNLIAKVDLADSGAVVPRGTRHGLTFDYAPSQDVTRIRVACRKSRCKYDGSTDYGVLRDALVALQQDSGHADYTPNF